ncbi:uncharacterized protein LOC120251895 [Dioscorea cayenensis subsp. rotundata]|uniref:Uncharacterized protein LOC120251895 n=1 Tax=Dioscorea cayennensis subsp. rotundata TaxID=55577 RepID=A0AB40ANM4_DIOCR|nr:uncharacterized protein LOC120251895 [Dioscorea cayenensis subsp. rotundata]
MKCDPNGPREANIARKPLEIPLEQWVAFVDYRARPDKKAKAEQNTINRTHQTMPHTLGSKSIARLENEMEKQLGRSVTRVELFQASHTTSDGSFANEVARHNHEDLIIRSQGSSENEAFTSVFGKEHPGYVRGMGLGVVPTQIYGSSSSSSRRNEASGGTQAEINELRDTVQLLRQQVQENEQRFQQQLSILTQQLANQNQNIATNQVLAFRDIEPQAPTRILIIPKVKDGLSGLSKAEERYIKILGYLLYMAKVVANQEGLDDGFRIVINDGPNGYQLVYHLHIHLIGGRQMNWPPG